jgi:prepilin peptidase CpaA
MHGFSVSYGLLIGLAIALALAAYTDIRRRQIDNMLNAGIALAAPLFWWASGMGLGDIGWQLALALGALVVLGGLFAFGAIGGGDVKLLVALALWIRPVAFGQLITVMAVSGGVLTLVLGAWHVARKRRDRLAIPYGVAIAIGGFWVLAADYAPLWSGAVRAG